MTTANYELLIRELHLITQSELNDLICDLDLSKENAQIIASRLRE